jgi:hypothetical protein
MPEDTKELAGIEQEFPLQRLHGGRIVGKLRPAGLLPIPRHEV